MKIDFDMPDLHLPNLIFLLICKKDYIFNIWNGLVQYRLHSVMFVDQQRHTFCHRYDIFQIIHYGFLFLHFRLGRRLYVDDARIAVIFQVVPLQHIFQGKFRIA